MMTAEQVTEAADLLTDREEVMEGLEEMEGATKIRIDYFRPKRSYSPADWEEGPEFEPTSEFVGVLTSAARARLEKIDKRLRELGVKPPVSVKA